MASTGTQEKTDLLRYQMYIGGKWVDAKDGETYELIDPATEEAFATVPKGGIEDAEQAIRVARDAFDHGPWPKMTAVERAEIMRKAA